jgi:hypothetical protein
LRRWNDSGRITWLKKTKKNNWRRKRRRLKRRRREAGLYSPLIKFSALMIIRLHLQLRRSPLTNKS